MAEAPGPVPDGARDADVEMDALIRAAERAAQEEAAWQEKEAADRLLARQEGVAAPSRHPDERSEA